MTKLAERLGIDEQHRVEQFPFAQAGQTCLFFVRQRNLSGGADQIAGVGIVSGMFSDHHAVFVKNEELPYLGDIINGIVRRGKLGQ